MLSSTTPLANDGTRLRQQLDAVRARIAETERLAHRPPNSVGLLAVSKTFPAEDVRQLHDLGQRAFGENYVQEALEKIAALRDLRASLEWHFIGPLQSNKTRAVAEAFDWVHTVDRLKIANRLSEQRPAHLPPLNVCVQVNISHEARKHGVAPSDTLALLREVAKLPRLRLRGLMAIPAALGNDTSSSTDMEAQRTPHRALHTLRDQARGAGIDLDTLSIGMSADLEAAIFEGSTLVRIGSAIFGHRAYGTTSIG
ncbi:YggS family pyridoxal phosphate enzyme [Robbsia andropogonis]|uniref:Pyridoxal phosphate homeostasis protein n=1 Tax=Robbsia andropogonis TaxID=28092 RepID=A0A0F5JZ17_9BURK|nr:YggS family pyridoxal phosphate-dependent enzyme [Robbsia andropogonis]KKB63058.1 YggS family pyridoxal phosphate enzyme [Robbsia andropogonis]MCP1118372.1 YggS family pyridoxal phosphate-dependent enzyme [Robbsia andropogonis]MCP1127849.1 YggS family pyridoxal phosphate-dependent enzyme [Robbsia andropogonis]